MSNIILIIKFIIDKFKINLYNIIIKKIEKILNNGK
jgi:hypothetical protein